MFSNWVSVMLDSRYTTTFCKDGTLLPYGYNWRQSCYTCHLIMRQYLCAASKGLCHGAGRECTAVGYIITRWRRGAVLKQRGWYPPVAAVVGLKLASTSDLEQYRCGQLCRFVDVRFLLEFRSTHVINRTGEWRMIYRYRCRQHMNRDRDICRVEKKDPMV